MLITGKYSKFCNGEHTEVYDLEKCLKAIRVRNEDNENYIKRLEEENKKLKEETWKDEELSEMKAQLEKMRADCYRGFSITESEHKKIQNWKMKHEKEKHNLTTIGGNYTYYFTPTSIGIIGTIKCTCGEKFTFCEI